MHGLTASAILKLIIRCANQGYNLSVKIYCNPYLRKKKKLTEDYAKNRTMFFFNDLDLTFF